MNFRLLVFDWDGTLMDSEARIVGCIRAAAQDLGAEPLEEEAIRNIIGLGLREAVEILYPGADAGFRERLAGRYRDHYLGNNGIPSQLFRGARETLVNLSERGYLLGVATGKGRRGLDMALASTKLHELFHATRCATETLSKPNPQMLQQVMEELGATPDETLMIGDTEYDMQMAGNAGTAALAVSYGVHERERLMAQAPLGCLDDISELGEWLAAGADKTDGEL